MRLFPELSQDTRKSVPNYCKKEIILVIYEDLFFSQLHPSCVISTVQTGVEKLEQCLLWCFCGELGVPALMEEHHGRGYSWTWMFMDMIPRGCQLAAALSLQESTHCVLVASL